MRRIGIRVDANETIATGYVKMSCYSREIEKDGKNAPSNVVCSKSIEVL